MRVLLTGADGFLGRHLLDALRAAGHETLAACRPGGPAVDAPTVPLELTDAASVRAAVEPSADAVVHLAAVAYSREANDDPGGAWHVNAGGTARLLAALADRYPAGGGPLVIVASTAEVYGAGEARPRTERDPPRPLSPYAASKLGAEIAAAQAAAAWGLRVVVVRPFPVTGPGQTNRLVPNWVARLRAGEREVPGDPEVVRDYLDVRDAAAGFVALLGGGRPGETYNLATGRGVRFGELFAQVARLLGADARLVAPPPALRRPDPPHLVGDPAKLRSHTGWMPTIALERTLADLINAQAH